MHKAQYTAVIDRLREIADSIKHNRSRCLPTWVFDLESCAAELMSIYKSESQAMGYSGKLRDDIPQLRNLQQAILRISQLCSTGGFSFSVKIIYGTIFSSIDDLERQRELEAAGT